MAILTLDTFSVDSSDLPETTIAYLVANGFSQAMRDSAASAPANVAKRWAGDAFTSVADFRAGLLASQKEVFEGEVAQEVYRLRNAKFEALKSGDIEIARTIGPKANTVEAEEAKVIRDLTKAWLAKRGIKYPSGKGSADAIREHEDAFRALPGIAEKVRKEAQRRFKQAQELSDLLGDL